MKVSVVIPVYNTAPYLDACISSVLGQMDGVVEAICVDDGSTDDSPAILAAWAAKDSRVRVIRQQNAGQGTARNRGVAEARGEFLLFVDSDDILLAGAIPLLLREVREAQVIAFDHITFSSAVPVGSVVETHAGLVPKEFLLRKMGVVWNKMVRREWWVSKGICFEEKVIYEDIPVHWMLVLAPERVTYLPAVLYALRIRANSTTGTNFATPRRLESIRAHDAVGVFFRHNHSWKPYESVYLEIMLRNLASCIDACRNANLETQTELRRLADTHLAGIDLSSQAVPGLSCRERDTLRAFQGHLLSIIRRHLFILIRAIVRAGTNIFR